MSTLTPIASSTATEEAAPRFTTLMNGLIADPEKDSLFRIYATGMKQLEQELPAASDVAEDEADDADLTVSITDWEPNWIKG